MKSCFLCKNMSFCKYYQHLFYKINYMSFISNTKNVIDAISESIAKNCNHYNQFECETKSQENCKWEIQSRNLKNESLVILSTSCGCFNPEFELSNIEGKQCLNCGKKIEVVK